MCANALTTGDPNFEYLFGGPNGRGIRLPGPRTLGGTSVLIEGFSGTGKTILACQLCVKSLLKNWPNDGYALIYTLDQPPEELQDLITGFGWLQDQQIAELQYGDAVDWTASNPALVFIKRAPPGVPVADLWMQVSRDTQSACARIVLIDAINSIIQHRRRDTYDDDFRRLVMYAQDGNFVEILTLERVSGDPTLEEYVPNCVIELDIVDQPSPRRILRIKKARNQQHFIGSQDFTINPNPGGFCVFPSLQARSEAARLAPEATWQTPIAEASTFGHEPIDRHVPRPLKPGSTTLLWGMPGTRKTELCARFLATGLRSHLQARALFITFKIEPDAFTRFLELEAKGTQQQDFVRRTEIIDAREPFELPTQVFTRIMEVFGEGDKGPIERAAVFGLRRIAQLPSYKDSDWPFLEVLVRSLHQRSITTLLVDWPDPHFAEVVPIEVDLCSNEIRAEEDDMGIVYMRLRRWDYEFLRLDAIPFEA